MRKVSVCGNFPQEVGSFCLLTKMLLISVISASKLASFFTKNAHRHNHCAVVTLPVFAVSIAISLALLVSLGAVLTTLIGWGSVDK